MKRTKNEKIALIWFLIIIMLVISYIVIILREYQAQIDITFILIEDNSNYVRAREINNAINKRMEKITLIYAVILFILIEGHRVFANHYLEKYRTYSLRCPKCGFVFNPPHAPKKLTSPYNFFSGSIWLKLPHHCRCPECRKNSWCSVIINDNRPVIIS